MRSVFITQKGLTHNLFVLSSQTNKLVNMCVSRFGPKDDLAVFNYSLKRRTLLQQSRASVRGQQMGSQNVSHSDKFGS